MNKPVYLELSILELSKILMSFVWSFVWSFVFYVDTGFHCIHKN